jgi:hypothetical protein
MPRRLNVRTVLFAVLVGVFAIPTAFFAFYGVQLVYASLTFEGEGSLGHVGMYVAALLFPLLALLCAGLTFLAWRRMLRRPDP